VRYANVCAFLLGLSPLPDLTLSTDTPQKGEKIVRKRSAMTIEGARDAAACDAMYLVIRLLKAIMALSHSIPAKPRTDQTLGQEEEVKIGSINHSRDVGSPMKGGQWNWCYHYFQSCTYKLCECYLSPSD